MMQPAFVRHPVNVTCPQCNRDFPGESPASLCPYCLLAADVSDTSDWRGHAGFEPPTATELQRWFDRDSLQILGLVGRGGMGAVFRARQPQLGRDVAVKILPPEMSAQPGFDERFAREAQVLAKLSHPNIVNVFEFGKAGPYGYLVLEFVDGANLRELLAGRDLTAVEALRIAPQLCEALQFAHDTGVVHRDIKPENILIDLQGRVKITDFGLAKLAGERTDRNLTRTQQVMGTVHYMAPEQVECSRDVDHRADIFALGVVFYEMLTGELPLGRFDPPSEMAGTSASLDDVVLRCLHKEPSRRYGQAVDCRKALEQASVAVGKTPPRRADRADRAGAERGWMPQARQREHPTIVTLADWAQHRVIAPLLQWLGAPLRTSEQWLGAHRLLLWFTCCFWIVLVGGALAAINAPSPGEFGLFSLATAVVCITTALCAANIFDRAQPGVMLSYYAQPLLWVAKPWEWMPLDQFKAWIHPQLDRIRASVSGFPSSTGAFPIEKIGADGIDGVGGSRTALAFQSKLSIGFAVIGWIAFFIGFTSTILAFTSDDDFAVGAMIFFAIAFVAGRLAASLARRPLSIAARWIHYPLLMPSVALAIAVLAFPCVITFVVCYDENLPGRLFELRRHSPQAFLISLYFALAVACVWWSLWCHLASRFPRLYQFVLYPVAQWVSPQAAYVWGIPLIVLAGGLGTLAVMG